MKVLILTTIMAPYRVSLFREFGKYCNLTVCFETKHDSSRNASWYEKNVANFQCVSLRNWDAPAGKIRWGVTQMIALHQPDVCISYEYSTPTAMVFMQQCRMRHIPYFINCDSAFIHHDFLKDMVKRHFISNATGCLANGTHAKEYFLYYGGKEENIFLHHFSTLYEKDILPTCVTLEEKAALKQKLGFENRKTVITVGQFIHRKGFDVLLKAWEIMPTDVNLIILGGGEKEGEYQQFIETHHLTNITLLGFKPFSEVLEFLKACDLFVLPTREDIWGLVINEAMACGLPVITTDRCIAGLELISNGENGYIVPVEDVDALAEKMACILENDTLAAAMGRASLERIRPYTIEQIAQTHQAVLKAQLDPQKGNIAEKERTVDEDRGLH